MHAILRVPLGDLSTGVRVLPEAAARYVTRVHRLRTGDRFLAFDPEARAEAEVEILETGKSVTCRIGVVAPSSAAAPDSVVLLWGIGKGDKPEQVVAAATALAVERVTLVESARAIVTLGDRRESRLDRYRAVAVEAARQCGRGDVPTISGPVPLAAALAEASHGIRLSLEPGAKTSLADALQRRTDERVWLLVGPEGGFSSDEIELCRAHGFDAVSLGRYVLRTELAAIAALGAIAARGTRVHSA